MSMSTHLLERGTALWKSGRKQEARQIFRTLIQNDPCNEAAWVRHIQSLETDQEKIAALEQFLALYPQHFMARKTLEGLITKAKDSTPPALPGETGQEETKNLPPVRQAPVARTLPAQKAHYGFLPWLLVFLGACLLLASTTVFGSRYTALQIRYERLADTYQSTVSTLDQAKGQVRTLQSEKQALTDQYKTLLSQYGTLSNDFTGLQDRFESLSLENQKLHGDYDSLYLAFSQLNGQYNTLTGDYNWLNSIALKPPYIFVHAREVKTAFYDTDGQLVNWSTKFEGLEDAIVNGTSIRHEMIDEELYTYKVYTESGETLWLRDFSGLIDPELFSKVMPEIYSRSSSSRDFVARAWNIVRQLAPYVEEENEIPRYPYETLFAGGGDCEDLSILFASLIEAAHVDWYVDLLYVDSDNLLHPSKSDHVMVYINTGHETFLVETTSDQVMLPYENGVTGWLASYMESNEEANLYPVYLK